MKYTLEYMDLHCWFLYSAFLYQFICRILELIQESKWLTRLGIQIPESASSVMMQEGRFKNYKSHLQLCLEDYKFVCKQISDPLQGLFSPHIENVRQQLHPGLNTLAWNSMNIGNVPVII